MINVKNKIIEFLNNKRILILGFGREGKSAYRFIKENNVKYISLGISDKNNIDINKLDLSESTFQSVEGYVGESQTMFFNEIRQYRLLTPEETRDLIIKAQNGNMNARDDLINHNIRLIISVAKKFNLQTNQITIGDLIQEGVFGLSKAIEKFDINKGYMF